MLLAQFRILIGGWVIGYIFVTSSKILLDLIKSSSDLNSRFAFDSQDIYVGTFRVCWGLWSL